MNLWEIAFICFALFSLALSVSFFIKKGDRVANRILGVYLLLFCLNLIYNVLYWSRLMFEVNYINIFGILVLIWLLYPPLMYFYVRRLLNQQKFVALDLIHFTPILIALFMYHKVFLLDAVTKLEIFRSGQIGSYIYFAQYSTLMVSCVMIFYTVLIYFTFTKNNNLSYNKTLWLKWVIGSFTCYVIAMVTYFILSFFGLMTTDHDYFIMYTIVLFIGIVAYFGFMQPDVFNGLSVKDLLPFKKYRKSGLSNDLSLTYKTKLIDLMRNEKPYLNPGLSLNDLAQQLNLSKHHLSQIINEHFDSTFYSLMNRYRIDDAKKMLEINPDLTINDIIYSCGFNNRVSFYNAFKLHTGNTPKAYKLNTLKNIS